MCAEIGARSCPSQGTHWTHDSRSALAGAGDRAHNEQNESNNSRAGRTNESGLLRFHAALRSAASLLKCATTASRELNERIVCGGSSPRARHRLIVRVDLLNSSAISASVNTNGKLAGAVGHPPTVRASQFTSSTWPSIAAR